MSNTKFTKSDVKKFLAILKQGLTTGKVEELNIYTSDCHINTDNTYVSLDFRARIPSVDLDKAITQFVPNKVIVNELFEGLQTEDEEGEDEEGEDASFEDFMDFLIFLSLITSSSD